MPQAPRIAVVGSANVDLTTFTDSFPRPGETIFAPGFDIGFGGKGANQAVAARFCGSEVAMVARLGNDLFGPATIDNFKAMGIDVSQVELVEGASSGVAPIFVSSDGQNRILVIKGANDRLLPEDIDRASDLLKASDCIVLQLEIPLETVYHTLEFAKANGLRAILNPAPALAIDMTRISGAEFFIPNESEAETLTGKPVANAEQASDCAKYLLDQGLRQVVITLGAQGAVLAAQGAEPEHFPAFEVTARDTTGAGDAFIGSFATLLGEGLDVRGALRRASLYAALSTTRVGTQKSFPKREEFEAEWEKRASTD